MQHSLQGPASAGLFPRRGGSQLRAKSGLHFSHWRKHHAANLPLAARATAATELVPAAADLLKAIEGTERGATSSPETLRRIEGAIWALEKEPTCGSDNGVWKLLWTTEKETLFIIKNTWFGAKAGEVFQIIDRDAGYLQNVITFPPKSAFVVDSTIQPEGLRRVNFEFSGAELQLPGRAFKLPPFGKGWFVNVYCDDQIRVSKDIRGDVLVTARVGPPTRFRGMQGELCTTQANPVQ